MTSHTRTLHVVNRLAHFLFGMFLILGPVTAQAGSIVADPNAPASQQPTVLTTGNGVPQVNIQTPSAAGVSRNTYSQFDVNSQGAILNNGRSNSQSQLAGWVPANPNLAGGTAKIILNEVNASRASNLNGYLEVAGDKAQVVVANPAGISCDGCGFINASRATLTTGQAQLSNGQLQGYNVQGGQISVAGAGLDSGSAAYTDLIARAIQINSGIWADHLNVVAGTGNVSADAGNISRSSGTDPAPEVAIDVSQLGGMYANSIRLLGTQAGVGVRNAGTIGSAAGNVVISADGKIENAPTGKIYGNHLAIGANTLDNVGDGTNAPVIAASNRLDIGVKTLNNQEQALIHSGGDLAIGGNLDNNDQATGQADSVNNASATLEAQGNLSISARQINNTNEHLTTQDAQVSSDHIVEYSGSGSSTHYTPDQVHFTTQDRATYLVTPDGIYYDWNKYDYTRTVTATQVVTTAPATITAGGNLNFQADNILNRDSHIVAGGDLTGTTGTLDNQETLGLRTTQDNGQVTHANRGTYCAKRVLGSCVNRNYDTNYSTAGYHITTNNDEHLNQLQTGSNTGTLQLPGNSLYSVNPSAPHGYLVETDPQFTDYRTWLSSDYMLQQLAVDPALTQMRLGDGYYEQQLVREQMAQLTGRRFLDSYSDDETQYQALMDAGVTFAKAHDIVPGVALTAAQVAQLTSDIVWLVEEKVSLPDGTTTRALVPKLYVLVKNDGVSPSGSLIAADNIRMNLSGDMTNHGTVAANNAIALTADNLHNLDGSITSRDTNLQANTDITNNGGSITGQDNLNLQAGRDINVTTSTRTDTGTDGSNTHIDRIAGLYVSSGTLLAGAGRNLNLTGAAIVNNTVTLNASRLSDTQLAAGNDFMLNSVQANEQQRIVWDPQTVQTDTRTVSTGTRIQTDGNLSLSAGHDLSGTATQIQTTNGNVTLNAGHDLSLSAANDEQHSNAHSATSSAQTDDLNHTLVNVNGDSNVSMSAGNDLNLTGTHVSAGADVTLNATGDTSVSAVVDSQYHHDDESQKAGLHGRASTTNETLASQVKGGDIQAGGNLQINANSASGTVNLAGVNFQSQGDTTISADNGLSISGMQHNSEDYHASSKSSAYGLKKSDQGTATSTTDLQNASLTSGGNTSLQSGADLTLAAANVTANGDVNMDAVNNLLLSAGQILNSHSEWKNNAGAFTHGDLYQSKQHQDGTTVTGSQASVIQAGGDVNARAGSAKIVGSDIAAGHNLNITTDSGDIDIAAAQTSTQSYSHDQETHVSLGSVGKHLLQPEKMVTTKNGRLTVKLAQATYDKHDTQTTQSDMRGSRLSSNNDLNINANAGAVNVTGSDLSADADANNNGNLTIAAATGINVQQATDTYDSQDKQTHAKGELSVVVQNQVVEVVNAYKNLQDAKSKLEQSKRDYRDYQHNLDHLKSQLTQMEQDYANHVPGVSKDDLVELRNLVQDTKSDKQWYVAGIALAAENVVSATTSLLQQTAAAAESAGTYGFNAGLQLDADASKSKSETQTTTSIASNLSGNNILLQTGTTTAIQGSNLIASNQLSINTGKLDITASQDTSTSSSQTEHGHITAQMTVYGASGGASINASFDRSKSNARSTNNNNSNLLADNIDLTTSGDANLNGATVRANSALNVNVQGNLNLESVQDRSNSRNTSAGVSAGVSLGGTGALSGVNGAINNGHGMSNTRQTVVTSLTSGGSATVNVKGHTQITGAILATTDDNGNDLNRLTLNTGSLDYADLRNSNVSSQTSAGISTSLGIADTRPSAGNNAKGPNGKELRPGTSNITYNNSQQNSASKSLATLGHGTISVGGTQLEDNGQLTDAGKAGDSTLSGLNRDTTHTSKTLWNSDQHQSVDVTVDHRLLTADGRKDIKEDAKRTGILAQSIADLARSDVSLLGLGDGETSLRQNIQLKQDVFTATKVFTSNPANKPYVDILDSGVASPAEKDAAYTALANSIAQQLGLDPVKAMTLVQNSFNLNTRNYDSTGIPQIIQGAYSPGDQQGLLFLADDNIGNTADAVKVLGHEMSHYIDNSRDPNAAKTQTYQQNRESYADMLGGDTLDYLNFNFAANDYSPLGAINQHVGSTLSSPTIAANDALFNRQDPARTEYKQLAIPEIHYVRDSDRVKRFANYMKQTTGEDLSFNAARAQLLQGAAGLMDEQWQKIYGTNAHVLDFLMTELGNDFNKITNPTGADAAREQTPALQQEELLHSNLVFQDPRTGQPRLLFSLKPGEYQDERVGVTDFMTRDNLSQIWDLMVPRTGQQRAYDNWRGEAQATADSMKVNPAVAVYDTTKDYAVGLWQLISSPVDTISKTIEGAKEVNAYGTLLEFEGRDNESGYIMGKGNAQAAMSTLVGKVMGSLSESMIQGALARARGGKVTVTADAKGQATGISIEDNVVENHDNSGLNRVEADTQVGNSHGEGGGGNILVEGPESNVSGNNTVNPGTLAGGADAEAGLNSPLISPNSPFNTKGVNPDSPSVQSVRTDLYNEYKSAGLSDDLAKNLADGNIKSGSTIPTKRNVAQGETLYKFVPSNNAPGRSSYYFTKSEVEYFKSNPEKLAQEAGLPYKNFVGKYDVYVIQPKPGTKPIVFESKVAEIQEGAYNAKGGANQTIVPNLKNWSAPKKVDELRVYGND